MSCKQPPKVVHLSGQDMTSERLLGCLKQMLFRDPSGLDPRTENSVRHVNRDRSPHMYKCSLDVMPHPSPLVKG